jgi:hypothetical protein
LWFGGPCQGFVIERLVIHRWWWKTSNTSLGDIFLDANNTFNIDRTKAYAFVFALCTHSAAG